MYAHANHVWDLRLRLYAELQTFMKKAIYLMTKIVT